MPTLLQDLYYKFYFNKEGNQMCCQSKCIYPFIVFHCIFSMLYGYICTWGKLNFKLSPHEKDEKSSETVVFQVPGRRPTWHPLLHPALGSLRGFELGSTYTSSILPISSVLLLLFSKAQRAEHAPPGNMSILLQVKDIISF